MKPSHSWSWMSPLKVLAIDASGRAFLFGRDDTKAQLITIIPQDHPVASHVQFVGSKLTGSSLYPCKTQLCFCAWNTSGDQWPFQWAECSSTIDQLWFWMVLGYPYGSRDCQWCAATVQEIHRCTKLLHLTLPWTGLSASTVSQKSSLTGPLKDLLCEALPLRKSLRSVSTGLDSRMCFYDWKMPSRKINGRFGSFG